MMYGWAGWGMWLVGPLVMVLIIWLVVSLLNDATGSASGRASADPRRILGERFARGEIDPDEYRERLATLERR